MRNFGLGIVVEALMALRGVNLVTAMTIVSEIGDLSRFESPRQLMAYLSFNLPEQKGHQVPSFFTIEGCASHS